MYILLILALSIFSISCEITHSHVENDKVNTVNKIENQRINKKKNHPQVKWIYITEPIYFVDVLSGDEKSKLSYKAVIFFENGEWGRVYIYTGIEEDEKFIAVDTSEGIEYGSWKKVKDNLEITIKKCECSHCFEDSPERLEKAKSNKQKVLSQNWKVKGEIGKDDSQLMFSKNKYNLLNNQNVRLVGFEDRIFEVFQIDEMFEVPCKELEKLN